MERREFVIREFNKSLTIIFRLFFSYATWNKIYAGFLHIQNDRLIEAIIDIVLGVGIFVIFCLSRSKHSIILDDNGIYLPSFFIFKKPKSLLWDQISHIDFKSLGLNILFKTGKNKKINFTDWEYKINQTVKPQFVSSLKEYAAAKGVIIVE